MIIKSPFIQPAAGEAGAAEASYYVGALVHELPYHTILAIGDHEHYRPLVKPELPWRYPTVGYHFLRKSSIETGVEAIVAILYQL